MRYKVLSIIVAVAIAICFSQVASAQFMTQDIVFVKLGYIPVYNVGFKDSSVKDFNGMGAAVQGEYNLNFSNFWLGFGLEYQYQSMKSDESGSKRFNNSFLIPMVSVKVAAVGGLYVGAGLSGKYLIATSEIDNTATAKKNIDLWANGIIGYYTPIGEGVFLDLEGRFGWNLTNKQFSKYSPSVSGMSVDHSYDIAFYLGVGFRAFGSNY